MDSTFPTLTSLFAILARVCLFLPDLGSDSPTNLYIQLVIEHSCLCSFEAGFIGETYLRRDSFGDQRFDYGGLVSRVE